MLAIVAVAVVIVRLRRAANVAWWRTLHAGLCLREIGYGVSHLDDGARGGQRSWSGRGTHPAEDAQQRRVDRSEICGERSTGLIGRTL